VYAVRSRLHDDYNVPFVRFFRRTSCFQGVS